MEIAKNIKDQAEEMLKQGARLPAQIGEGQFYLSRYNDDAILAHAVIKDAAGTEYKIGTKK